MKSQPTVMLVDDAPEILHSLGRLMKREGYAVAKAENGYEALERVGLADRMDHEPNQLSGGQQQRVAIARSLVNQPSILLADEPTGNLDSRTSVDVMSLFQDLNDQGMTIILVTHEHDISHYAKRIVEMKDGRVLSDYPVQKRLIAGEMLANIEEAL